MPEMFSTITDLQNLNPIPDSDVRGLTESDLYKREDEFQNYYAELERKQDEASMLQEGLGHLRFNTATYSMIEKGVDLLTATPDPTFDLDATLTKHNVKVDTLTEWERNLFETAVSEDHLLQLQEKAEDRKKYMENAQNLGGLSTFVADMASEVLNPINYLPLLGAAGTSGKLMGALVIGGQSAALSAIDTGVPALEYSDITLTDVVSNGIMGGVLGGAMGSFITPSASNAVRQELTDNLRNVAVSLRNIVAPIDELAPGYVPPAGSVGSMGVDVSTELAREGIDVDTMAGKVMAQFQAGVDDPTALRAFNRMVDEEIPRSKGIRPDAIVGVGESIMRSDNPMARYIGSQVFEHAEGTGGKIKADFTADLMADVYFTQLSGNYVAQYKKNFATFKQLIKGTGYKPQDFGDLVYKDINAQQLLLTETPFHMLTPLQKTIRRQATAVMATTKKYTKLAQAKGVSEMKEFTPSTFHLTRQYDATAFVKLANLKGKDSVITMIQKSVLNGEHFLKYHQAFAEEGKALPDINAISRRIGEAIFNRMSRRSIASGADANLLNTNNQDLLLQALRDINVPEADYVHIKAILDTAGKDYAADPTKGQISMNMSVEHDGMKMTDLLNTDLASGYLGEVKTWTGRAALAEKGFPDKRAYDEALKSMVEIGKSRAGTAGSTEEGLRAVQSDFDKLQAGWKLITGQPLESDVNSPMYKMMRGLRKLSAVSKLGKLGFAQAAETARMVSSLGVLQTMEGIPFLGKMKRNAISGRMEDTILRDLEDAGMGRIGDDYMLRHPDFRVDDLHENAFKGEKYIDKAAYVLGHASGFNVVQKMQKRFYARQYAMRLFRDITDGKLSKIVQNDIGFSDTDITAIKGLMIQHSVPIPGFGSRSTRNLHVAKWPDEFREKFIAALHKQSNRAILKQNVGDLPIWAQTSLGKFFSQFRTFSLASGGKHGVHDLKMLKVGSVEGLNTFLLTMGLASGMYIAKTQIDSLGLPSGKRKKFIKNRLSNANLVRSAMNWSGQLGIGAEAIDYLGFGLLNWGGEDDDIHFNRSTEFSDALGSVPGIGYMSNVSKAAGAGFKAALTDYKLKQSDLRAFMSTVPFSNVMGISNIRNIAEDKFN